MDLVASEETSMNLAASAGDIDTMKQLQRQGHIWNEITCAYAAEHGHLHVLQWLRTQTPPCPWNKEVCASAAWNGHIHILKWLRSQTPPDGKDPYGRPCPWDEETCMAAARNGHLEVLKWAQSQKCPWDERTCTFAAEHGHLEILKWARSQGCPWSVWTCSGAAANGYLDILKWVRSQTPSCPWDEYTCRVAAVKGHLEVLKWALEHGCPPANTFTFNRKYYDLRCWLLQHNYIKHTKFYNKWIQAIDTQTSQLSLPSDLIRLIKHYI